MKLLSKDFLLTALKNSLVRFPMTVATLLVYVCFLLCWIWCGDDWDFSKLITTTCCYLTTAFGLSLLLHLWGEEVADKRIVWSVSVVLHLLWLADTCYFFFKLSDFDIGISMLLPHFAMGIAICLCLPVLALLHERNDVPAWNFATYLSSSFFTAGAIGFVMTLGINLLFLSFKYLFGIRIGHDWFLTTAVFTMLLLPAMLFLGTLPQGEAKHNRMPVNSAYLKNVIRFLILPLVICYLLILYAYAALILIRWELPDGWVSWLVTASMAGCLVIEWGIYPDLCRSSKQFDSRLSRLLPLFILPLLALMTVGIVRRISDYGITVNRLYIFTLNIWFYVVCIGLYFTKARRIAWIPYSFSLLFLLTTIFPLNYAGISFDIVKDRVEQKINQVDSALVFPLRGAQLVSLYEKMPDKDMYDVRNSLNYLMTVYGDSSVSDLVQKLSWSVRYYDRTDVQAVEVNESVKADEDIPIVIPQGYGRFTHYSNCFAVSNCEENSDKVIVTLPKGGKVELSLEQLMIMKKQDSFNPQPYRTDQEEQLFLMTGYELTVDAEDNPVELLTVSGYLFEP